MPKAWSNGAHLWYRLKGKGDPLLTLDRRVRPGGSAVRVLRPASGQAASHSALALPGRGQGGLDHDRALHGGGLGGRPGGHSRPCPHRANQHLVHLHGFLHRHSLRRQIPRTHPFPHRLPLDSRRRNLAGHLQGLLRSGTGVRHRAALQAVCGRSPAAEAAVLQSGHRVRAMGQEALRSRTST